MYSMKDMSIVGVGCLSSLKLPLHGVIKFVLAGYLSLNHVDYIILRISLLVVGDLFLPAC